MAGYWEPEKDPYETMLSTFERGLTVAQCDAFFASPAGEAGASDPAGHRPRRPGGRRPLHRDYPVAIQRQFSDFIIMDVMDTIGTIASSARRSTPSPSTSPVTTSRITTHYFADQVASSLYSVVHEGGHAPL